MVRAACIIEPDLAVQAQYAEVYARYCRLADGPDEVHMMALGKQIIKRFSS